MGGKASRKKGHAYELKIAEELRKWFPDVVTSRSESKRADDKGKDLMYTEDLCIQCKATETSPSYPILLAAMQKEFPKEAPMIFRKQNNKIETVTMLKTTFYDILDKLIKEWMKG